VDKFIKNFTRQGEGVWMCVRRAEYASKQGRIEFVPGTTFSPGQLYMGIDVAEMLEAEHRRRLLQRRL